MFAYKLFPVWVWNGAQKQTENRWDSEAWVRPTASLQNSTSLNCSKLPGSTRTTYAAKPALSPGFLHRSGISGRILNWCARCTIKSTVPLRPTSGFFPHFHIFWAHQRNKAASLLGPHLSPPSGVFSSILPNSPLVKQLHGRRRSEPCRACSTKQGLMIWYHVHAPSALSEALPWACRLQPSLSACKSALCQASPARLQEGGRGFLPF